VRRVVDEAFSTLGKIDVVVSNAGYGLFGAAEEVSDEQIRAQIDTNLIGSIQVIRAALPRLRKQGGGRILQVSSEGGQIAYPNFSLYHATKWGIEGFVEAVAQEVEAFNIQLTLIEPGATATDFGKSLVSPPPLEVYENTAVGAMRRAVKSGTGFTFADANKTGAARRARGERGYYTLLDTKNRPVGGSCFNHRNHLRPTFTLEQVARG
jgi:NAD(P)-dependent dehydrogenase (short-subunit alcohol dehydrogenase family)